MKRFFVKLSLGSHKVIDRKTNKMVVSYSKKDIAEKTCNGLNRLRKPENISKMISKLQTVKGYTFFNK